MWKTPKLNLKRTNRQSEEALAILNRELVLKLIALAGQTGEVEPLIEAVQNLSRTSGLYTQSNTTAEHAELQKALGDTLYKIARKENHKAALDHAIIVYRGSITVASMLDESKLRSAAKRNCTLAMKLRSSWMTDLSSNRAA